MQMTAFLPIRFSPSPRPTVVVVFPSPRRGVDRGHEDELAVRPTLEPADEALSDLGLVVTVGDQRLGRDAEPGTDLLDGLLSRRARDLDIGLDSHGTSLRPCVIVSPRRI